MQPSTVEQSPNRKWIRLGLAAVLLLSLWLRLTGIDWDGLYHLHPDERYMVWVGTTIEFPTDWETAFDPARSTFNPFHWPPEAKSKGIRVAQGEPRDFAYGHWPLYLGVAVTHLLGKGEAWGAALPESWVLARDLLNVPGRIEYHHLLLAGRALAAVFDTLTVWLAFSLGRRLYGAAAGLAAAAFVALAVLHIQQAHFFVTDPFLTTVVVAAVHWMARRAESGRLKDGLLAGLFVGLAVGAKFSAILLAAPLGVALIWRRRVPPAARRRAARWLRWLRRPALELAAVMLVALVVFAVTNPFALLDNSCTGRLGGFTIPLINFTVPPIRVHSCYLENIGTQGAMVRGSSRIPFTFQYIGARPYLYFLDQMFRWGLGGPLTLVGFGGLVWGMGRALKRGRRPGEVVLLAWAIPFFAVTGSFQVKFLRYLLPLTPFLAVFGAGMLVDLGRRRTRINADKKEKSVSIRVHPRPIFCVALAGTLLISALWAAAFVGMYRVDEHPWVAASRWIYERVPSASVLAQEHWDHGLPLTLREDDWDAVAPRYREVELEWFDVGDRRQDKEDRATLETALQRVASADYLVLASNRLYGVIPRLPARYPEAAAYYRLLFAGDLGFELVHWHGRYPTLGPLAVRDDPFAWPRLPAPGDLADWEPAALTLNWGPADESFTVYDHPLVLIFENRGRLGAAELERLVRAEIGD